MAAPATPIPVKSYRGSEHLFADAVSNQHYGPVINARIIGVPIPVASSYPGVVGNSPLLLVRCPIPVIS